MISWFFGDRSCEILPSRGYDGQKSWINATLKFCFVIGVPILGPAGHAALYLCLAGWSLIGPRPAIEALTLTWLANFLNPGIYSLSDQSTLLGWLVICTAFVSVVRSAARRCSKVPHTLLWLWAFAVVNGVLTLTVSYAPGVSLFKLLSFTMGASTVLIGFHLTRQEAAYWRTWFLVFFVVITFASFPLIFHPLGYVVNQKGFQGLMSHPQTYGPFIGVFLPWLLLMKFEKRLRGVMPWLIMTIGLISLLATKSRTGLLAAFGSMLLTLIFSGLARPGLIHIGVTGIMRLSPLLIGGVVVAILNVETLRLAAKEFVLKYEEDVGVAESFQSSRGSLIETSIANFYEHPVTGIGFGVASDPHALTVKRDPLLGLPVSAPVEKGFVLIAALEELGIIGFAMLLALIGSVIRPTFHFKGGLAPMGLALGALLINIGESVFFSFGGSGLLVWLMLGAARATSHETTPWHR